MPISVAIGALLGGIGITAAGITFSLGGALLGGVLGGLSYLLAPKRPSVGSQRPDTRHTVTSAVSPARWIVGRARIGGVMVFYKETNGGRDLHIALVLSEGACDGIERIWAGGEEIEIARTARTGDGESGYRIEPAVGDPHRGRITIYEYFKGDGTEGDSLRAAAGEDWTDAHKLNGLSWVHVRLCQPNYGNDIDDRFWSRFPELNFLVRGIQIAWPGQTTPEWTENAAAIRYWWLRTRRGLPEAAIDAASFTAAHSLCEQDIRLALPEGYEDYAATSKRYAVNGVVHADDDPERIEAELDFAWQGWAVEIAGIHHFRPGADRPVARFLTPDEIIAIDGIQPAPPLQDRINAATVSLAQSREHDWLEASLPEFNDTEAESRDGERLPQDLGTRAFVADPIAGGRLLAIQIRRARASATFTYRVKPGPNMEWLAVQPSDWVRITDPEHGLEYFQAMVSRTVVNEDWSVTLDLVAQPNGVYADTLVLPPLKPRAISIPRPRQIPAVTGLSASHAFVVSRDGTVVWHIDVAWDDAPYHTRLRVTDEDENLQIEARADGTSQRFTVDGPSTYTVTAVHVSLAGFASPPASTTVTFDWTDVPVPAPVVMSSEQHGTQLHVVVKAIANRDVEGLESDTRAAQSIRPPTSTRSTRTTGRMRTASMCLWWRRPRATSRLWRTWPSRRAGDTVCSAACSTVSATTARLPKSAT